METNFHKALTFTVPFFPQCSASVTSRSFSSGGCEWFVMGSFCGEHLSPYLYTNKPDSLGFSWKRRVIFYFTFLNRSGKEICRSRESGDVLFCAERPRLGFHNAFSLKTLLEKEFLVKDEFSLEVNIKVVEIVAGKSIGKLLKLYTNKLLRCEKETVNVNGFQVLSSQATSVRQIFVEHPDIALGFKSKNQVVKTTYMNILLGLLETVKKPLKSISEIELNKAQRDLCELTEVGFKLEWLKTKLEKIALANTEGFKIQQLEEQVKKLELTVSSFKVELEKEKIKSSSDAAKVLWLEQKLSNLKVEIDDDLFKPINCQGIQERKYGYKKIN